MPLMRRLFLSFTQPKTQSAAGAAIPLPRVAPGDTGVALTILRPAGRAEIGGAVVDVLTGGDFIEAGTRVRVLSASGPSVVVGRDV
jgi:membrane-bound serine protease (ClpP class)